MIYTSIYHIRPTRQPVASDFFVISPNMQLMASRTKRSVVISGDTMLALRESWGLTQAAFADLLGMSREWVARAERPGAGSVGKKVFERIGSLCGIWPNEVIQMLQRVDRARAITSLRDKGKLDQETLAGYEKEAALPRLKARAKSEFNDRSVEPYSEQRVPQDIPTFEISVAAGPWTDVTDVAEVMHPGQIDHGLFRIRIAGDSMRPAYQSGIVIEFRCLREGRNRLEVGRDYYVQRDDGTATFKRLVSFDADQMVFAGLNKKVCPSPIVVERREVVRMAVAVAKVEVIGS